VASGDKHISLVEGETLLGPGDLDCFIDAVHPNTCGLMKMAAGLAPTIREVLGL